MSEASLVNMDNSQDSGIGTEKDSEKVNKPVSPRISFTLHRRQSLSKYGFKSLTALGSRSSLENLQKIRRKSDGSRRIFFGRGLSSAEKRSRRRHPRKRFDKSNAVSEVNIRKVTHDLTRSERKKLVNVVGTQKSGKSAQSLDDGTVDDGSSDEKIRIENNIPKEENNSADSTHDIVRRLEKLRLGGENLLLSADFKSSIAQNPEEAKSVIDYGSGDARQDFSLNLNLGLPDESFAGMACAQIFDSKRRNVQWKREVDVIYYAGDADGDKIVRRENEPLREEADQQARRNRFIQLAFTKNLLSNVSACQLRDPWLVVLPK